jgi:hypothetical protein
MHIKSKEMVIARTNKEKASDAADFTYRKSQEVFANELE